MAWNENEYYKHIKYLAHMCPYTKQKDGGNGVQCDTYSKCSKCGWNPKVARIRKAKIRAERAVPQEPEKWWIGRGEFPKKMSF